MSIKNYVTQEILSASKVKGYGYNLSSLHDLKSVCVAFSLRL